MVFKRNVFYFKKIQAQIQRLAHKAKSLQGSVKQLPVVISIVLLSLCLDLPLTLHESLEGQQHLIQMCLEGISFLYSISVIKLHEMYL